MNKKSLHNRKPKMENKLQVNVDFSKYPELYKALQTLVINWDTDNSKLVRQLIRQAWERYQAEQDTREAEGMGILKKKVDNGRKSIKQLRRES